METRSARYRRMALDDKLRAIRTEDPSKKRAFDRRQMSGSNSRSTLRSWNGKELIVHHLRTTAQPEPVGAGHCATDYSLSNRLSLAPVLHREPSVMRRP
jgi:hypothetical protein